MDKADGEIRLNRIDGFVLCDLCLDGAGGECHTPGCFLWLCRAPDLSIRERLHDFGAGVTVVVVDGGGRTRNRRERVTASRGGP